MQQVSPNDAAAKMAPKAASLLALLGPAVAQLPSDFHTASLVAAALDGEFRAHGDFDRDGDVDLLHFYGDVSGWSGCRVFANDGQGRFTRGPDLPFQFPAAYPGGSLEPYVADFDGDGNLDFAIARDGVGIAPGEGVEFFLGDGQGGFPNRLLLPVAGPRWLAVGNIDADGASELALASSDPSLGATLSWIDFQGGQPTLLPPLQLATGGVPLAFVFTAIDADGDGVDDIAATARTSTAIDHIRLFPTQAGTPTLGASFPLPLSMQDVNHRILAGDLDGDGDRDLLVVKMATLDIGPTVLPLERSGPGLVLRAAQTVPTPATRWFQPHDAQLADWNGDGWLDLCSSSAMLDVLQSTADWRFAEGFEAATAGQGKGGGAFDCDGDGHLDFVGGQSILRGDGSFTATTAIPFAFSPTVLLDIDGDGDVDLVQDSATVASFSASFLAANDGSGAWSQSARSLPPPAGAQFYDAPIARGDFDGDGRDELIALSFTAQFPFPGFPRTPVAMERLVDRGAAGFAAAGQATASGDFIAPPPSLQDRTWAKGDVDGDGDLDLLMDGGFRPNQGMGSFAAFVPAWSGRGRAAADVSGDGWVDVLTTAFVGASSTVSVHYGGPAGFVATALGTLPGEASAHFLDLDGDGDLDVAAAAPTAPGLLLFENRNGQFLAGATTFPDALVRALAALCVADIDGDGALDLLLTQRRVSRPGAEIETAARYRLAGPNLGFALVAEHILPAGASVLGFADVDADGDPDAIGGIVLRCQTAPATNGSVRQYGIGRDPSGALPPLLGALGPPLSTSNRDELRLTQCSDGVIPLLAYSLFQADLPDVPFVGLSLYAANPEVLVLPPVQGIPGLPESGRLSLPLPNLPFLAGWTIAHQVFTVDPANGYSFAASNGLLLTYGR